MTTAAGYGDLARVFLRISLLGFGGPNAHIALMLDEVVERRRWLSRQHFLDLVAVTNLLPGPNSSEVAIHVGYTQRGWRGGLVSGLAFLGPTFVLVVLLSFLYFRYGAVPGVERVFWGIQPVIVAVILAAGWKLGREAVTDVGLRVLAAGGLIVAVWLDRWQVAAMAIGGLAGLVLYGRQERDRNEATDGPPSGAGTRRRKRPGRRARVVLLLPGLAMLVPSELSRLFWVTLWSGSLLFGGGYMLVPLLTPFVVGEYGWLTPDQFLDGIALTQVVPGPIVMVVAFVGYSVAGIAGAAVATAGIYLPSFAAVFAVAPFVARWRRVAWVRAVLKGVNGVVAGAIVGAGLALAPPALPDAMAVGLLIAALVALVRFNVSAVWVVAGGIAAGLARHFAG